MVRLVEGSIVCLSAPAGLMRSHLGQDWPPCNSQTLKPSGGATTGVSRLVGKGSIGSENGATENHRVAVVVARSDSSHRSHRRSSGS